VSSYVFRVGFEGGNGPPRCVGERGRRVVPGQVTWIDAWRGGTWLAEDTCRDWESEGGREERRATEVRHNGRRTRYGGRCACGTTTYCLFVCCLDLGGEGVTHTPNHTLTRTQIDHPPVSPSPSPSTRLCLLACLLGDGWSRAVWQETHGLSPLPPRPGVLFPLSHNCKNNRQTSPTVPRLSTVTRVHEPRKYIYAFSPGLSMGVFR